MPKILCTLENASSEISGVKFDLIDGVGRVSEEVSEATAEIFLSIPGYELATASQPSAPAPAPAKVKAATAKAKDPAKPAKTDASEPAPVADDASAEPLEGHPGADTGEAGKPDEEVF